MKILVTGGAGFIGSALVRFLINETDCEVLNLDKLTYAGHLESLKSVTEHPRYRFVQADICDSITVTKILMDFVPDKIIHLAAESHVDRSVDAPAEFVQTNIIGTFNLLNAARALQGAGSEVLFHHVSTDEVFGSLGVDDLFTEATPYAPRSPYSATKASSDHLVRAWGESYGLPFVITNCSNNYGPYQFPEKLIPLMIMNALEDKRLPVYGDGSNIRDWLYIEDHVKALYQVATEGQSGTSYNIGGNNEMTNLQVVNAICEALADLLPNKYSDYYKGLITFVGDRPGHDFRYAIDNSKIKRELGWAPLETFETGLRKTIIWYLDNQAWCKTVSGNYHQERLGLKSVK